MKTKKENGFEYFFTGIPNLRCDMDGNFNYKNTPIKKQWRPGQIFIKVESKRIGLIGLRKSAVKKEIEYLPF